MKQQRCRLPGDRTLGWYEVGEGTPLVLLHGWAASGLAFVELAGLLESGFRVLCPDLPGHGHSSPGGELSLGGIARDLECWLDKVDKRPAILAGWSLGGMLALEMAGRSQLDCAALVLIGTTPRFVQAGDWPHGLPATQLRAMQRNLGRNFNQTLAGFFELTFAGEVITRARLQDIRRFAIYPGRTPDPAAAAALLELLGSQDQRPLVSRIVQPTTLVHGGLDQITPSGAATWMQQEMPRARLALLDHCGHAPFWSQPERVAACIAEAETWAR